MLLAMFAVASWGQALQTDALEPFDSENNGPLFTLKNGRFRRMTPVTCPTEHIFNAGLFAFHPVVQANVESTYSAYKIYCVSSNKWLSYTLAEVGGYNVGVNFVKLVDTQDEAGLWYIANWTNPARPKDKCYTISPYNSNPAGNVSSDGKVYDYVKSNKCLNWTGSYSTYPNDVTDMTVGLTEDANASALEGGGAWMLRNVSTEEGAASFIADCKTDFDEWKATLKFGDGVGQNSGETEYNAAYTKLEAAYGSNDVCAILVAAQECWSTVSVNGMQEGKYYRLQNVAKSSYIGYYTETEVDGYDMSLYAVDDENGENPTTIWQYEKIDGNYYLKNVFSSLYVQAVTQPATVTAPSVTIKDRITVALESYATTTDEPKWRIYAGDGRMSINQYNAVIPGSGEASLFYISEVKDTDGDNFGSLCCNWYNKKPKLAQLPSDISKIVICDEADFVITPVGLPNSKEAMYEINSIVDDLDIEEGEEVTQEKIWRMYKALHNSQTEMWENYCSYFSGSNKLSSSRLIYKTKKFNWATICVPSAWGQVAGWTRYNCNGMDKNTLKLNEESAIDNKTTDPNVPYIVKIDSSCFEKSYQFIFKEKDLTSTANPTNGWLVGVYGFGLREVSEVSTDGQTRYYVPKSDDNYDRYVLAKQNSTGKVGFYLVKTANLPVSEYQCYLEIPKEENAARYSFLFFQEDGDVETGIDNILDTDVVQDDKQGNKQNGKIYNMAGQRLNRMQKGLNIVNGKIIIK